MAKEQDDTKVMYDLMPGAEALEQPEGIDLNFGLDDEGNLIEDEAEDDVAEETQDTVVEEEGDAASEDAADDDSDEVTSEAEVEEPEEVENTLEEEVDAPKKPMVPKSRLDEVLAKQKALQKQLDDMRAQQQPVEDAPEAYDFDSKEIEYQNFLLDGEASKAAALRQ